MGMAIKKEEAHKIIDDLPPGATLEDLVHVIYVREQINKGLEDLKNGSTFTTDEIRKRFGLSK